MAITLADNASLVAKGLANLPVAEGSNQDTFGLPGFDVQILRKTLLLVQLAKKYYLGDRLLVLDAVKWLLLTPR